MKKTALTSLLFWGACLWGWGQTTVSQDLTVLGSYGLIPSGKAVPSVQSVAEVGKNNGYLVNDTLTFSTKVAYFYDILVKLNAKSRIGTAYTELQAPAASVQTLGVTVDTAYGRLNLLNVVGWSDPFDLYLQVGKYSPQASNYQRVSLYGMESALNMVKMANGLNAGLELTYKVPVDEALAGAPVPLVSLVAATSLATDEGVVRLYDNDGTMGAHATVVLDTEKYALPLFGSLKASNLPLPFGTLSAEGDYALHGNGVYSGHSFGASALVNASLVPTTLTLPVGLGVAWYEKNTDTLASQVGTPTGTDVNLRPYEFRNTLRVGLGAGLRYLVPDEFAFDLNAAGSFTQVGHYLREDLTLMGCSLETKVTWAGTWFLGAGALLGTLSDLTWKTKAGVPAAKTTFLVAENYGAEAYAGLNFGTKGTLVLGVNNNRGLAMNYGLESLKEGEFRFLVGDSSYGVFETCAVYLKATFKL